VAIRRSVKAGACRTIKVLCSWGARVLGSLNAKDVVCSVSGGEEHKELGPEEDYLTGINFHHE
jgi:hypothetical protein